MFGVAQRDHEARYGYAQEWVDVVKRAWSEPDTFDVDGEFFKLKRARSFPKPYGGARPMIMNAGSSPTGQDFALRNCDALFTTTGAARMSIEGSAQQVADVKAKARALGREIEVYTVGQVICRPSQQEADEYYHHANIENADWGAIERMLALRNITRDTGSAEEFEKRRRYFAANAIGGFPYVGTPDKIAEELANLSRAGLRGVALSFVNYLRDLPYFCGEVLPRLERMGLREARAR
jgi:alkanesulfonate monooxygenase SsuD/methylene tetrahydromethanopterin reductase-like flavin-dependent oxidoreductase (luciferase family)